MTLYWSENPAANPQAQPRLHALVIGVGDYVHMGLNAPQPAKLLSGLPSLTITVPAARRMTTWLEREYSNAARPLGSIEVLLSPAETLTRADGTQVPIAEATMKNITDAFNSWYARCDTHRDNVALFYFAGHGISTASHFLLASDFGNPALPDEWKNCIDATSMQAGLVKCKAKTQLFFLDACRDAPVAALVQRNPHGDALVGGATLQDHADVSVSFRAAADGRKAYGKDGEETYFCKALMMCLEGVAARKAGPNWGVDTAMLAMSMASVMSILAKTENLPLTCECPIVKPVPFHFPATPQVLVKIGCEPDVAKAEATIEVRQNGAIKHAAPPGSKFPWVKTVPAGDTQFDLTFQSFPPHSSQENLSPPTYELEVTR